MVPISPAEAVAAIVGFLAVSWLVPTVLCVRGFCCPLAPERQAFLERSVQSRSGSEVIARQGIPHATAPLLAQQPAAVPPAPVENWRLALALLILAATIENSLTLTTFSVESLAAHNITGDEATSTLPTTSRLLGATMAAGPASLLMGRVGRRLGFVVGAVLAVLGALLCALAVHLRSYYLRPMILLATDPFCIGILYCFECRSRFVLHGAGITCCSPARCSLAARLVSEAFCALLRPK